MGPGSFDVGSQLSNDPGGAGGVAAPASGGAASQGFTNPFYGSGLKDLLNSSDPGFSFFGKIIPNLIGLALLIGVIVFFFYFVIGAIQWIASGGDKGAIEAARGRVTQALVGLFVLFAAFAIIKLIEQFFGINILALDIGVLKIE